MHISTPVIVGIGLTALGLALGVASAASAHPSGPASSHRAPTSSLVELHPAAARCAAQTANDNGIGIHSSNFPRRLDTIDANGADDFTLSGPCTISEVDVAGVYFFRGKSPARSVRVVFYEDEAGAPGAKLSWQNRLAYTDPGGRTGNFDVPLRTPVALGAGTYWISVMANTRWDNRWAWMTNTTQLGSPAVWRNRLNGLGTGCTTFKPLHTCIDGGEGTDFAFALLK